MNRNTYDGDITTWSPEGRLFQAEYAMEAVKQGSATVALKSKTHVVLAAVKRAQSELSSFQEKIFKIDDHCGMSVSGLVTDGRYLAKFMRGTCMDHRYMNDEDQPVSRLAEMVGSKYQQHTRHGGLRPFGVGLFLAGHDDSGPHLMQMVPSGDVFAWKATAMGARSQAARTYLEKNFEAFPDCTLDQLVQHSLLALQSTTGSDGANLTDVNTTLAVVGVDRGFEIVDASPWIAQLPARVPQAAAADDDEDGEHAE
jgi:20S proteasome subunit alpha 6